MIILTEIIPSINVQTFPEVQDQIKKVEPYVQWCHIDVTDGVFSKHPTWQDPADLVNLKTPLNVEAHLMVENPEAVIDQWLVPPVKRIIVHLEAMKNPGLIIEKCREKGIEIGFAIKPETSWEILKPWFNRVDMVQTLSVHPGPSGQPVDWPNMLSKIFGIHAACPGCIIEVDGGINPHTYKNAISAGANVLVVGSFIFDSSDIRSAIEELKK